jgi:hypothetical protein
MQSLLNFAKLKTQFAVRQDTIEKKIKMAKEMFDEVNA